MRAKNADCDGWMCAVKALTPKIATEHLMVNALLGFELVAQVCRLEKLHHSRQTVNFNA